MMETKFSSDVEQTLVDVFGSHSCNRCSRRAKHFRLGQYCCDVCCDEIEREDSGYCRKSHRVHRLNVPAVDDQALIRYLLEDNTLPDMPV